MLPLGELPLDETQLYICRARPAMSKSLSKKSGPLGMKRRAEQADGLAGSGLPKRQRESRGTDNGAVQSEDTDEGMLRGKAVSMPCCNTSDSGSQFLEEFGRSRKNGMSYDTLSSICV